MLIDRNFEDIFLKLLGQGNERKHQCIKNILTKNIK